MPWAAVGADVFSVGAAKAAGGAGLIALNFWVARHLEPGAYGLFAFATTCVLLVDSVVGSALDAVVLRYASRETAGASGTTAVERTALLFKVVGVLVIFATVAAFGPTLAAWLLQRPEETPVIVAAAAAGSGVLLLRSLQVHFQVTGRLARYGIVEMAHVAVRIVLVLLVLAAGVRSAAALVGAYAAAPLLIVLAAGRALFSSRSARDWWQPGQWRAVSGFAGVAVATCGIGALVARLDVIVLAAAGAPLDLGLFGVASTVALVPTLLGAYVSPALSPRIVPYCRDRRFPALFAATQSVLFAAALTMFGLVVVISPTVVASVLPESYMPAIPVIRVLTISGVAGLLTFPLTLHFLLFFSPRLYLTMDIASLPLLIPAYAYAARHHGALGVAWVSAAASVTKAAIAQGFAIRLMQRADLAAVAAS